MALTYQTSSDFHRAEIAPTQLTFLLCIEGNRIEHQGALLCESIRRYGGRYSDSPIAAVSPRSEVPISLSCRRQLRTMQVDHVELQLNKTGSSYLTINRIVAGAWAETNLRTPFIIVLDSDMVFAAEPTFFCCDAGVRPVDTKGSTSAGPLDKRDAYWARMCEIGGVSLDQLPWLDTSIDRVRIRASFNGGFTVVRRASAILQKTADIFFESLKADIRPFRDEALNVYSSTGHVGKDASEYWGSSQAALSVALAARADDVVIYDDRYNIPLHLLHPDANGLCSWPTCAPILLHYHWLTMPEHRSSLLGALRGLQTLDDWERWFIGRLDAGMPG